MMYSSFARRLLIMARMAAKDLLGEWTVSLAVCLTITAVAAPVLVLIALYTGVVDDIFSGLRDDPSVREIRLTATGAARFDEAFFVEARTWPAVSFAVPSTRYASAQGQLLNLAGTREARANLIPTGPGDPVFPPAGLIPGAPSEAGISAGLAKRLGAAPGDRLQLEVTRSGVVGVGVERVLFPIKVVSVARAADFARDAIFISHEVLVEIEDYKNGHRAPLLKVEGTDPPPRRYFPNFRLYAVDIADVGALVSKLSAEPYNLSLRTEQSRIDFAMRMDRSLTLVISAIGLLGILGLAGGLATIQWSMAARRRRTIAVLSLIGFSRASLVGLPVIQALMLSALGSALTVLTAWAFTILVDSVLAGTLGLGATRLDLGAVALVTGMIFGISVVPAFWIGRVYSKLEPSDEIRET
jgi:putative ABC transport system permease protein